MLKYTFQVIEIYKNFENNKKKINIIFKQMKEKKKRKKKDREYFYPTIFPNRLYQVSFPDTS